MTCSSGDPDAGLGLDGGDQRRQLEVPGGAVEARPRPQRPRQRGPGGDHVEGHAAVEPGDVHAQPAHALGAVADPGAGQIVEGDGEAGQGGDGTIHVIGARRVAADAAGAGAIGEHAAVTDPGGAGRRLAHDGALDAGAEVRLQEVAHRRGAALLVAGEEEADVVRPGAIERRHRGGDGALGVAAAQAVEAVAVDGGGPRIARPAAVGRHGVDVGVDQGARGAPAREQVAATAGVVGAAAGLDHHDLVGAAGGAQRRHVVAQRQLVAGGTVGRRLLGGKPDQLGE